MTLELSGRVIEYTNELIYETDFLRTNLYNMTGVSKLAQTLLGTGVGNETLIAGLPCTPTSPASLNVIVGTGQMYSYVFLDATAYGVLPSDTNPNHELLKQFLLWDPVTLAVPTPVTSGHSVIHLVECIWQTQDVNVVSRPYFNTDSTPTNPLPPIFATNPDTRYDTISVILKPGIEGPSPTPPTPDAGYTALYYITVPYGATTITNGNISKAIGAPFITESLTQKISSAAITGFVQFSDLQASNGIYAVDSSGTANTITVNPSPAYTSQSEGTIIRVKVAHTNTPGTSTLQVNSLSALQVSVVTDSGSTNTLVGGEMNAGNIYEFFSRAGSWLLVNPSNYAVPERNNTFQGNNTFNGNDIFNGNETFNGQNTFTNTNTFTVPQNIPAQIFMDGIVNGTNVTYPTGSSQVTTFTRNIVNTLSGWDSTNKQFIAPFPGKFRFSALLNLNYAASGPHFMEIKKNGTFLMKLDVKYTLATSIALNGSTIDIASTSDIYQLWYNNGDTVSATIGGQSNELFFAIEYLGT